MCNMVMPKGSRATPKKIPETGVGWKLLYSTNPRRPPFTTDVDGYIQDVDGWISWRPHYGYRPGDGFAFFLTEKEAKRALLAIQAEYPTLKSVGRIAIYKIVYKDGLVSRQEKNFITGKRFTIALCKRWSPATTEK